MLQNFRPRRGFAVVPAAVRLLAVLAAAVLFRAHPAAAQADAPVVLRPGDAVRIAVYGKADMSGEFAVTPDGAIAHPLYRGVVVAGVPLSEVDARLRRRLQQYETNPEFVVEPLFRVSVGGEVRQPNLYMVGPDVTLMQAVAKAGGLTERGRLDRVRLMRDGSEQSLDLSHPTAATAALTVRSGDQIYVERRRDTARELIAPVASVVAAIAAVARLIIQ
jgi:polysaccharide export outer membrane protein